MLRILHSRGPSSYRALSTLLTTPAPHISTMGTASSQQAQAPWKAEMYTPTAPKWPYTSRDFSRDDESPDTEFYETPKFVTHIDDSAIEGLRRYYDDVLPRGEGKVLDFCSSWVSHYPERIAGDEGVKVYGTGLNREELDKNPLFGSSSGEGDARGRRAFQDLNADPDVSKAFGPEVKFSASTCTVSIDYLSQPLEVLSSLRSVTAENGTVHLAISNRAFWHKVVRRWMEVDETKRLEMVGDYLWFAGWREVEIVTVASKAEMPGFLQNMLGMGGGGGGGGDPLWVVRGRNVPGVVKESAL